MVEIGPGPGALTRALLLAGAARVVAVERDPRCVDALAEVAAAAGGRLQVVEADARGFDPAAAGPAPVRVAANLPYGIASRLLAGWLPPAPGIASFTLMFQREVADRIAAAPGGRDYGRLSVLAQWCCEVRTALTLPPEAFVPAPAVHSTLLRLDPRPAPLAPAEPAALELVTRAAFGARRKMLRSALAPLGDAEGLLGAAGIDPAVRGERLAVGEFCALARALAAREG